MTVPRTRLWAALASLVGLIPAAGAASVSQPSKAIATHAPFTMRAKAPLVRPIALATHNPNGPAQPFVLQASASDRALAERCLAQAVYYEAGLQPLAGRQAVAQTVLNRLRHPAYPKSVCGVVYEGSALRTGCQFSFTCDGSLHRAVDPWLWQQAEVVAESALNGFVMPEVGEATYYHADYVRPYWAGALKRITQIGAHIFYRWPGASGDASAFTGQYAGHEADVSAVARATDPRLATLRPAVLRRPGPSAPELREAVARGDAGGFRVIEAGYTTSQGRVHSIIPAAEPSPRSAPSAATVASLADLIHPAKVTLPPVHATDVATPTVIATAIK